jgi:Restriction endonuclease XhoI
LTRHGRPVFSEAIRAYWGVQSSQAQKQIEEGTQDTGRRGEVTGGQHLDGFLSTIERLLVEAGVPAETVYTHKLLSVLPGFFRPTKVWDLLVVDDDGRVRVVIELKSIGSSFGNNANNRAEEAIGNAQDLWVAYRENAFGGHPPPWLGYLFVLPDVPKSAKPVRIEEPHHLAFEVFRGSGESVVRKKPGLTRRRTVVGVSYAERLQILCGRLVRERLYSEACLLLTKSDQVESAVNYRCPADDLGADRFVRRMLHAATSP